ncbi:MAG: hypothetical protein G01um101418_419 [Parcubacteria group bacterium Gr01-1014_18]|nr:MAG: hypothetical protein Greene041636_335 [Parcubacteria group bacterium Greene0416_36]TSC81140.1 MAG: hypothetical protein G01um101418_419 [Parcubacteria group bacterium Gr01-1014_18]TSC98443.1 MAG: hypothetical protein Greene101420_680 [Parcubacteria group bacterium Greene1014_20]TSD07391.1 MAG: hypothetical protein Greene07142_246 [Parcubacteria group bacterium Greene0714_2]
MTLNFVTSTQLQKKLKKTMGQKPMQILLSNNKIEGMIFSKKMTEMFLESDLLTQIREELWELNDPETVETIREARLGKGNPVDFEKWAQKYEL